MERLTDRGYEGRPFMREPVEDEEDRMVEIVGRLAAYEDTGLEPEEVRRMKETLEAALKDLKKHASCGVCSFRFCYIRGGVEPCNFQYKGTKEATDR